VVPVVPPVVDTVVLGCGGTKGVVTIGLAVEEVVCLVEYGAVVTVTLVVVRVGGITGTVVIILVVDVFAVTYDVDVTAFFVDTEVVSVVKLFLVVADSEVDSEETSVFTVTVEECDVSDAEVLSYSEEVTAVSVVASAVVIEVAAVSEYSDDCCVVSGVSLITGISLCSREGFISLLCHTPIPTIAAAQSPDAVMDIRLISMARLFLRSRMASTSLVTISAICL